MPLPRKMLSPIVPADADLQVVAGAMPADLRGAIFMSGPDPVEKGQHAFYGDGVLYRISLEPGQYGAGRGQYALRQRTIETPSHRLHMRHREAFVPSVLGVNSPFGFSSQANTAQVTWGDRLFVTWDAGRPVEVDPHTLGFLQEVGDHRDWGAMAAHAALPMIPTPAHPVVDPDRNCLWTCDYSPVSKVLGIVRYDGEGKHVTRWPLRNAPIPQSVHTISQTRDWLIIVDNGYKTDIGELIGRERSAVTNQREPVYLIRKDDLERTVPGDEVPIKRFEIGPECMHFYADYDDSQGIRVFFEHSTDSDIACAIRPGDRDLFGRPLPDDLAGMYGLALSPQSVSLMEFDPEAGTVSERASYADPDIIWNVQTSGRDWSARGQENPSLHHVMYNGFRPEGVTQRQLALYEHRIDRALWPAEERPCSLVSFDWKNDLKPRGVWSFELDSWATTPVFVPRDSGASSDSYQGRDPGGHDGYVVAAVLRDDGFRLDIFDAARVGEGPVASLAAPGLDVPFLIHGSWMPELHGANRGIERLRFSDEIDEARLAKLSPEHRDSVRQVAAEIDAELDAPASAVPPVDVAPAPAPPA